VEGKAWGMTARVQQEIKAGTDTQLLRTAVFAGAGQTLEGCASGAHANSTTARRLLAATILQEQRQAEYAWVLWTSTSGGVD